MAIRQSVLTGLSLIVSLMVVACCPGCVVPVVVWKADSILSLQKEGNPPPRSVSVGFRNADFHENDGRCVIDARGCFPREHETYVFWALLFSTAHPYPDYHRKLLITWPKPLTDPGQLLCRIELVIDKGWPDGHAQRSPETYAGETRLLFRNEVDKVAANLRDVELRRTDGEPGILRISGVVVARRAP